MASNWCLAVRYWCRIIGEATDVAIQTTARSRCQHCAMHSLKLQTNETDTRVLSIIHCCNWLTSDTTELVRRSETWKRRTSELFAHLASREIASASRSCLVSHASKLSSQALWAYGTRWQSYNVVEYLSWCFMMCNCQDLHNNLPV